MIVKMDKITLLVSEKHISDALWNLRRLGVVHVEPLQQPSAHYIDYLNHRIESVEAVAKILSDIKKQKAIAKPDIADFLKEVIALNDEKEQLSLQLDQLNKKSSWYDQWGDVSEHGFAPLERAGIFLKLYAISKKEYKKIKEKEEIHLVKESGPTAYIAYITGNKEDRLDFVQISPPHEDLQTLKKKIYERQKKIKEIDTRLKEASIYKKSLIEYKKELFKGLEFCRVKFGVISKEGINCLKGFCPRHSTKKVSAMAKKQGWGIVVQKPDKPQEVPTLIKNPKWVRMIRPVFNFMGTLPGYKEYDVSLWFLIFFSLFFAMLIGDAGYGLIFLGASFFAQKKIKKAPKEPFFLMYTLSVATVIWGAITGTWFGYERIAQLPFLNFLVINRIDSFAQENQSFMIYLCFLIGAIHLSIAHLIKFFRYINSLVSLAQIGWVFIIWFVFYFAGGLVLSRPIPNFASFLGIVGAALVILFSNPQKNILKGMLLSISDLPLNVISSFSDVVSYLRLFAVGYSTVAIASTFNNMALATGMNTLMTSFLAACILVLGHALNILLGIMSVIVHGIRLNMLEFSGHLDMQWSGKEYRPFKE